MKTLANRLMMLQMLKKEESGDYPTDGLLAHYPFYNDVKDKHNHLDGVASNISFITKEGRKAAVFDDTKVTIDTDKFNLNTLTISFWMNTNTREDSIIFEVGASSGYRVLTDHNKIGTLRAARSGGFDDYYSSYITNNGKWQHCCFVFSSSVIRYFFNAELKHTRKSGKPLSRFDDIPTFGMRRSNNIAKFSGLISDFFIYNKELSQKEIQQLYNYRG